MFNNRCETAFRSESFFHSVTYFQLKLVKKKKTTINMSSTQLLDIYYPALSLVGQADESTTIDVHNCECQSDHVTVATALRDLGK